MKITQPKNCPSCGFGLILVKDQLFCRNTDNCPAQSVKKLQHFCSALKIKGFGEKSLEKLELSGFNDLLDYNKDYGISKGLGSKTAENLETEVQNKLKRKITVAEFIKAVSIPLIGSGSADKLSKHDISSITKEILTEVGVGDKAAESFLQWKENVWETGLEENWKQYIIADKTPEAEYKGDVCITGKLLNFRSRAAAALHLSKQGWNVKSSVTKSVKYLICEDDTKVSSSSYKKALSNNIEVLTIEQLEEK